MNAEGDWIRELRISDEATSLMRKVAEECSDDKNCEFGG